MSILGQALQVFRKDVRRFWPWLLGIGVLGAFSIHALRTGLTSLLPLGPVGWIRPVALAAALLAAVVVLEDSPSRDSAFLGTRPVSHGGLFAGKMLFLVGVLIVIPAAAQALLFATQWEEGLWVLLRDSLVVHGALIMMVAAGASLGRSASAIPWLILWGMILFVGGASHVATRIVGSGPSVYATLGVAWSLVGLVLGAALAAHQYLARRPRRTLLIGVLTTSAALLVVPGLELDWVDEPVQSGRAGRYPNPDGLDFGIGGLYRFMHEDTRLGAGRRPLEASLILDLPGGHVGAIRSARVELTGAPNSSPRRVPDRYFPGPAIPGRLRGSGDQILGSTVLGVDRDAPWGANIPIEWGDAEEVDQALAPAEGVRIDLTVDVYRIIEVGSAPLAPEQRIRIDGVDRRIMEVVRRGESVDIMTLDLNVGSALTVGGRSSPYSSATAYPLVLRHREKREILPALISNKFRGQSSGGLVWGASMETHMGGTTFASRVPAASGYGPPVEVASEEWFDGAEIVVLGLEHAGTATLSRVFAVEHWPMYGESIRFEEPLQGAAPDSPAMADRTTWGETAELHPVSAN